MSLHMHRVKLFKVETNDSVTFKHPVTDVMSTCEVLSNGRCRFIAGKVGKGVRVTSARGCEGRKRFSGLANLNTVK